MHAHAISCTCYLMHMPSHAHAVSCTCYHIKQSTAIKKKLCHTIQHILFWFYFPQCVFRDIRTPLMRLSIPFDFSRHFVHKLTPHCIGSWFLNRGHSPFTSCGGRLQPLQSAFPRSVGCQGFALLVRSVGWHTAGTVVSEVQFSGVGIKALICRCCTQFMCRLWRGKFGIKCVSALQSI